MPRRHGCGAPPLQQAARRDCQTHRASARRTTTRSRGHTSCGQIAQGSPLAADACTLGRSPDLCPSRQHPKGRGEPLIADQAHWSMETRLRLGRRAEPRCGRAHRPPRAHTATFQVGSAYRVMPAHSSTAAAAAACTEAFMLRMKMSSGEECSKEHHTVCFHQEQEPSNLATERAGEGSTQRWRRVAEQAGEGAAGEGLRACSCATGGVTVVLAPRVGLSRARACTSRRRRAPALCWRGFRGGQQRRMTMCLCARRTSRRRRTRKGT